MMIMTIFFFAVTLQQQKIYAETTTTENSGDILPWEGNSWDWKVAFCYPEDFDPEEEYVYVKDGEMVSVPTYVSNGMRTITGWRAAGEDENYDFSTPVTDDLELYPVLSQYMVEFFPDRIDKNEKKTIYVVPMGTVIPPDVESPGGYVLDGWQMESGTMFDLHKPITGDIKLFAKWKKINVTLNEQQKIIEPETLALSRQRILLPRGKQITVSAKILPFEVENKELYWDSSDCEVATVENGRITGICPGTVRVTATTVNGLTASCKVTVSDVKLNATSTVLQVGTSSDAVKIETKYPFSDRVSSYRSSNPKILKVDDTGKITAKKKIGKAVITVTMHSGAMAVYQVTVQRQKVVTKQLK